MNIRIAGHYETYRRNRHFIIRHIFLLPPQIPSSFPLGQNTPVW